jgi:hypothetical protein
MNDPSTQRYMIRSATAEKAARVLRAARFAKRADAELLAIIKPFRPLPPTP